MEQEVKDKPKRLGLANSERVLALVRRLDPPRYINHAYQVELNQVEYVRRGAKSHVLRIYGFEMFVPGATVSFYGEFADLKPGWIGKITVNAKWARSVGLL